MSSLLPVSKALELFDLAGLVDMEPAMAHPAFGASVARYRDWISSGAHATMAYLERGADRKADPRRVFAATQSVLVVGRFYSARPWGDGVSGPKIARYARGGDYHETLSRDLNTVCESVGRDLADPNWSYKVCVDTSAVPERTWAAMAGLGWIGKNGMLIHPRRGSYFLVGVALLSQCFGAKPKLLNDLCGNCERCITGCPTQAIVGRASIASARCISYQTLEHRGADPGWPQTEWIAGCDVCQDVCPFNTKAAQAAESTSESTDWAAFLDADPETLHERHRGTALARVGVDGWRRNVPRLSAKTKAVSRSQPAD